MIPALSSKPADARKNFTPEFKDTHLNSLTGLDHLLQCIIVNMSMLGRYMIPASTYRVEEEIKKSRFITTIAHTQSVAEARLFIDTIREEFSNASHNCWAYVIGAPGSTDRVGMSDDGEPHGTAGRPMLHTLSHADVGDVSVVVTRYFGGTLLGKGGLVKAYSGGVQLALEGMPQTEHVPSTELDIVVEYSVLTPIQRVIPDFEAQILNEDFAADITLRVKMPNEQVDAFSEAITNMTNGDALIEVVSSDAK